MRRRSDVFPIVGILTLSLGLTAAWHQVASAEDRVGALAQQVEPLLPAEYRPGLVARFDLAGINAIALADAIREAPADHRGALGYLIAHMPERDLKSLTKDFLLADIRLAHEARAATTWGKNVPEEIFLDAVLPYASINERRDDWRKDFMDRFLPIAKACATPGEAANKLNREVFKVFNVKYHATKRPKPDQSPYESIEAGFASCTGLSILLIDACRAVGIPARMVGVAKWTGQPGNHTWVEVWDRQWHFLGACEPSDKLDDGWFVGQAAAADEAFPLQRIYATSFRGTESTFPMVWARDVKYVAAEDVTRDYTRRQTVTFRVEGDPTEIVVRRAGRIVARDVVSGETNFRLAGDRTYQVTARKLDGAVETTREVQFARGTDPVIALP